MQIPHPRSRELLQIQLICLSAFLVMASSNNILDGPGREQSTAAVFSDRLPGEELSRLRKALSDKNLRLREGTEAEEKLAALRAMYEPYVSALARSLLIVLPPWLYPEKREDNWQVAPWDEAIAARSTKSVSAYHSEDHF